MYSPLGGIRTTFNRALALIRNNKNPATGFQSNLHGKLISDTNTLDKSVLEVNLSKKSKVDYFPPEILFPTFPTEAADSEQKHLAVQ